MRGQYWGYGNPDTSMIAAGLLVVALYVIARMVDMVIRHWHRTPSIRYLVVAVAFVVGTFALLAFKDAVAYLAGGQSGGVP